MLKVCAAFWSGRDLREVRRRRGLVVTDGCGLSGREAYLGEEALDELFLLFRHSDLGLDRRQLLLLHLEFRCLGVRWLLLLRLCAAGTR